MPTSSTPTPPEAAHASEEPLDLLALAKTDVSHPLAPPLLRAALSSPPFVALPGSFNTRDLGLLPGSPLPPGLAYRSGGFFFLGGGGGGGGPDAPKEEAENANAAAAAALVDRLRVRKVFDLRSAAERERAPDPAVAGVEGVWVRPEEKDAEVDLAAFVEGEGEKGYAAMYLDVLRVYQGGFRKVLEHVRDRRGEPFLFHCTGEFWGPWGFSFFCFFVLCFGGGGDICVYVCIRMCVCVCVGEWVGEFQVG